LINNLQLKIDPIKYPGLVFLFDGDKSQVEYSIKSGNLWLRHSSIWSVFEQEYSFNYSEIQSFIKILVEDYFKCKGITPKPLFNLNPIWVEDYFKCKGITPDKIIQ